MSHDPLYNIAREVTDEVMGAGTYAQINKGNPDPGVQDAILRGSRPPDFDGMIVPVARDADDTNPLVCPLCAASMSVRATEGRLARSWVFDCPRHSFTILAMDHK